MQPTAEIDYLRRFMKNIPPIKQKNSDFRPREFLTESEIEKLYSAAKKMGTFGYRNYCMLITSSIFVFYSSD